MTSTSRCCIKVEVNIFTYETNFTNLLIRYGLPLLKFGKTAWSVAGLSSNKRYDLLSLDCEGSPLWKAKQPLSKIQLEREQLLKRVLGFAS